MPELGEPQGLTVEQQLELLFPGDAVKQKAAFDAVVAAGQAQLRSQAIDRSYESYLKGISFPFPAEPIAQAFSGPSPIPEPTTTGNKAIDIVGGLAGILSSPATWATGGVAAIPRIAAMGPAARYGAAGAIEGAAFSGLDTAYEGGTPGEVAKSTVGGAVLGGIGGAAVGKAIRYFERTKADRLYGKAWDEAHDYDTVYSAAQQELQRVQAGKKAAAARNALEEEVLLRSVGRINAASGEVLQTSLDRIARGEGDEFIIGAAQFAEALEKSPAIHTPIGAVAYRKAVDKLSDDWLRYDFRKFGGGDVEAGVKKLGDYMRMPLTKYSDEIISNTETVPDDVLRSLDNVLGETASKMSGDIRTDLLARQFILRENWTHRLGMADKIAEREKMISEGLGLTATPRFKAIATDVPNPTLASVAKTADEYRDVLNHLANNVSSDLEKSSDMALRKLAALEAEGIVRKWTAEPFSYSVPARVEELNLPSIQKGLLGKLRVSVDDRYLVALKPTDSPYTKELFITDGASLIRLYREGKVALAVHYDGPMPNPVFAGGLPNGTFEALMKDTAEADLEKLAKPVVEKVGKTVPLKTGSTVDEMIAMKGIPGRPNIPSRLKEWLLTKIWKTREIAYRHEDTTRIYRILDGEQPIVAREFKRFTPKFAEIVELLSKSEPETAKRMREDAARILVEAEGKPVWNLKSSSEETGARKLAALVHELVEDTTTYKVENLLDVLEQEQTVPGSIGAIKKFLEAQRNLQKINNYIPHYREGSNAIAIFKPAGNGKMTQVSFSRFDTKEDLNRILLDAKARYGSDIIPGNPYNAAQATEYFKKLPSEAEFMRLWNISGLDRIDTMGKEIKGQIFSSLFNTAAKGDGKFYLLPRQDIPGWQQDFDSILKAVKEMVETEVRGKARHDTLSEVLKNIETVDPRRRGYVNDLITTYQHVPNDYTAPVRNALYSSILGLNIKYHTGNLVGTFTYGLPEAVRVSSSLGLELGSAAKAWASSWGQVEQRLFGKGSKLDTATNKLLDMAADRGIFKPHLYGNERVQQVEQILKKTTDRVPNKLWNLLQEINQSSETAVRMHEFLTFRKLYEQKFGKGSALENFDSFIQQAVDHVYNVHQSYGRLELPLWMKQTGKAEPIVRMGQMFMNYPMGALSNIVRRSLSKYGGTKSAAATQLTTLLLTAGVMGVPASAIINKIYKKIQEHRNNPEADMQRDLEFALQVVFKNVAREMGAGEDAQKAASDIGANLLVGGLPATVGIDAKGWGLSDIPWGAPDQVLSVLNTIPDGIKRGMKHWDRGRYSDAVRAAIPAPFMNGFIKAYDWNKEGARTPEGDLITDEEGKPVYEGGLGLKDIAVAANFRLKGESDFYRREQAVRDLRLFVSERTAKYTELLAKARFTGNGLESAKLIQEIAEYNNDVIKQGRPDLLIRINQNTIKNKIREMALGRQMVGLPARMRGRIQEIRSGQ